MKELCNMAEKGRSTKCIPIWNALVAVTEWWNGTPVKGGSLDRDELEKMMIAAASRGERLFTESEVKRAIDSAVSGMSNTLGGDSSDVRSVLYHLLQQSPDNEE